MNQNRLAHAALYLTNVAGHRTVYRFYPTWTDNPKRRGLILTSRELPGALQELDEITYPHFRLHHEKYLSARMPEQTDIVKSLLPVPEDVDPPTLPVGGTPSSPSEKHDWCVRRGMMGGASLAEEAAMSKTYLPYDPDQQLLLPAALREWLPDDHLAYFISDVVDQLDL